MTGPRVLERIGVFVFPWGKRPPSVGSVVEMAQHIENCGIDSVHIPWHFTLPRERFAWGNRSVLDPLVVMPAIAAATRRVRIALNCGILPLLHPFFWAKYLATLDVMSEGRVIAGLALGWWPEDFQAGLAKADERGRRMDEGIRLLRKLWKGEEVLEAGRFWDARGLEVEPLPSQEMPLWIGGNEKSIDRAARWAHGLMPFEPTLDAMRDTYRSGLDAAAEKYQRPRLTLAPLNYCFVIDPEDDPTWIRDHVLPLLRQRLYGRNPDESIVYGTAEQCAENIARLFAAGADYLILDCNLHGWETEAFGKEQLDRFVEKVVPLLK